MLFIIFLTAKCIHQSKNLSFVAIQTLKTIIQMWSQAVVCLIMLHTEHKSCFVSGADNDGV